MCRARLRRARQRCLAAIAAAKAKIEAWAKERYALRKQTVEPVFGITQISDGIPAVHAARSGQGAERINAGVPGVELKRIAVLRPEFCPVGVKDGWNGCKPIITRI